MGWSERARAGCRIAGVLALVTLATACGDASASSPSPAAPVGSVAAVRTTPFPATATSPPASPVFDAPTPSAPATIGSTAAATAPAERVAPPTACQTIAAIAARARPGTDQVLIVRTERWADTVAIAELATLDGGRWHCAAPMSARVGRNGLRPLVDRRSGDGTTPAGVFPLATMTAHDGRPFSFFGNSPDPGVTAGEYRRVVAGDCFGATPGTASYGHLRFDRSCAGPNDEALWRIGAYTNAALIGANMEPDVSGDEPGELPYASAIFLHRHSYDSGGGTRPTSGCVSLAQDVLDTTLVAMRASMAFAIGTTEWLLQQA